MSLENSFRNSGSTSSSLENNFTSLENCFKSYRKLYKHLRALKIVLEIQRAVLTVQKEAIKIQKNVLVVIELIYELRKICDFYGKTKKIFKSKMRNKFETSPFCINSFIQTNEFFFQKFFSSNFIKDLKKCNKISPYDIL